MDNVQVLSIKRQQMLNKMINTVVSKPHNKIHL